MFDWTGGGEVGKFQRGRKKRKQSKATEVWGSMKKKKAVLLQKQEGLQVWGRHGQLIVDPIY